MGGDDFDLFSVFISEFLLFLFFFFGIVIVGLVD